MTLNGTALKTSMKKDRNIMAVATFMMKGLP